MTDSRPYNASLYAMAFGNFAAGISSLVIAGITTEMAADLSVSQGQIGMLVTIFSLAYALGSPIIAAFTGNVNRRQLLIIGQILVLVGNAMVAIAPTYGLTFLARIVSALGSATFVPLALLVAISLVEPEKQGQASAVVLGGFALSTALGVPIGAYIGITLGWRASFAIVCLLAILAILCILRWVGTDIKTPVANLRTFGTVLKNRLLALLLSISILHVAAAMVVYAFVGAWLREITTLEASGITLLLILSGVGAIVGTIYAGRSTDRFGARITQLVMLVCFVFTILALPLTETSLLLGGVIILVWGAMGQGFMPPHAIRITNANPDLASASLSLNSSCLNLGISLGALIASLFIDQTGVRSLPFISAAVALLPLGLFALTWRMENA